MGVYKGVTFNLGHQLTQMLAFRPRNKFEELNHCWLVGGGTYPGSGFDYFKVGTYYSERYFITR